MNIHNLFLSRVENNFYDYAYLVVATINFVELLWVLLATYTVCNLN